MYFRYCLFHTFVFVLLLFIRANTAKLFGIELESWKLSKEIPKFSFISYRKYILHITQPSKNRFSQLQYGFAVISEVPSSTRGQSAVGVFPTTLFFNNPAYSYPNPYFSPLYSRK